MKTVNQDDSKRTFALATYWLVFLVGIPMWWSTTSIPKHPLPIKDIKALKKSPPQPPKDQVRMKGYPGYQLSITVISPDDSCPDLHPAYAKIFQPRLARLSQDLAYFKVDFQCRLHAHPPGSQVETFVRTEWNLANSISSLPIINFLVYTGPYNTAQPALMYPQWGVVYISPPDHEQLMATMFNHLLQLLGIGQGGLQSWLVSETDICRNQAIDSLSSLLAILNHNPNIPIPPEVSRSVCAAVESVSKIDSVDGAELRYGMARNALDAAEAAFYHPAMLGRQYFPQEHVLAVYVPLFVPLLMPLVVQTGRHAKGY